MGGALLQQVNRDTLKFALKCSAIDRGGKWHNVYKNPKTDPSKASKGGRFNLLQDGKEFATVEVDTESGNPDNSAQGTNALETILEDGKILRDMTLPGSPRHEENTTLGSPQHFPSETDWGSSPGGKKKKTFAVEGFFGPVLFFPLRTTRQNAPNQFFTKQNAIV